MACQHVPLVLKFRFCFHKVLCQHEITFFNPMLAIINRGSPSGLFSCISNLAAAAPEKIHSGLDLLERFKS